MQEDDFVQQVTLLVKEVLPEQYIPIQKANLYYQITVDNNLEVTLDLKSRNVAILHFKLIFAFF